ncbi:MAG: sigma 54-interacting transcriptional regulator [Nitrospiraceae bacterium]
MKLNCAAIPTGLLESELFGHERAPSQAIATKKVKTATSSPGRGLGTPAVTAAIFLDEVGEIPLELQVKLLRVLQEQNSSDWAVPGPSV